MYQNQQGKHDKYDKYDNRLNVLSRLCTNRIKDLLYELEVDLYKSGNKYIGNCPIHGDSDSGAFNLYPSGYRNPGYWVCRTKSCQHKFKPTVIGFTRGVLSYKELDYHWEDNPGVIYPFSKTINFLCDFLKVKYENIKVNTAEEIRRKITEEEDEEEDVEWGQTTITREQVQKNLIIPAPYFLSRGFSSDILKKYDIGMAKVSKSETVDRVIVPLYDNDDFLLGYTARSIFEKCPQCKLFHDKDKICPQSKQEKSLLSKWRNIDFNSEQHLYNFWNAKPYIVENHTAILVEGPGDVWRLEESGIHNSVAMFGHTLYDGQERWLAQAQCMNIIVLTDNDGAGREGAKIIKQKYGRLYRMFFPNMSGHDIGGMNTDEVTNNIRPYLESIKSLC